MDPVAARVLRDLFTAKAGAYPRLVPPAHILFKNAAGSKFKWETATPAETADALEHILKYDGIGPFNRKALDGIPHPLYLRMEKRIKPPETGKEHLMIAFNFTFREADKPGTLLLPDPHIYDYYWLGDEKIDKRPPFTGECPSLSQVIEILRKAGGTWEDVNFMRTETGKPKLRLVKDGP